MGYFDELDVVAGLAALEMILERAGFRRGAGCRVTAAQRFACVTPSPVTV